MTGSTGSALAGRALACIVLATLCGWVAACREAPPLRNVLFLMVEDQGAHAGYLDTPAVSTPRIDALAAEGIAFDQAFVVTPVCSASKAAIYTGRYPRANGLRSNTIDYFAPAPALTRPQRENTLYRLHRVRAEVPTLVEVLAAAGYRTGVVRKLHVSPNEKFPYASFIPGSVTEPQTHAAVAGFLDDAERAGAPWFLMLNIGSTHRPFPDARVDPSGISPDAVRLPGFLPDTPVVRQDWADYLAAVQEVDLQVGLALDALARSGAADETVVVLMSDHGPAFQRGKLSLHMLGIHVPLVIRLPGRVAGTRSRALVSEIDLMPTLLELLDLDPVDRLDGRSLVPIIDGQTSAGRDAIFAELAHGVPLPGRGLQERSIFDGRYQLIARDGIEGKRIVNADLRNEAVWRNRTYAETVAQADAFPDAYRVLAEIDNGRLGGRPPRLELYDVRADPDQLVDLADDLDHAETRARLLARLGAWLIETGDLGFRLPLATRAPSP